MDHVQPDAASALVLSLDDATLLRGLATLRWHLDELMHGRPPVLVVDISHLSHLSSPTLAALLWAQRVCRGRGGHVVLRGANSCCRSVLEATGLLGLFGLDDQAASHTRDTTSEPAADHWPTPLLALLRRHGQETHV